jgi:cell wall-associated NlpC family hydrolase
MLASNDLPRCESHNHDVDHLTSSVQYHVSVSGETFPLLKRFIVSGNALRCYLRRGGVGLLIPAAVLASAVLPQAHQETGTAVPASVTYAVRRNLEASVIATNDAVVGAVDLSLGRPQTRPLSNTGSTTVWLNLRTGPSTGYRIITTLAPWTSLTIHEQQNGWYRVTTANGSSGWVYGVHVHVAGTSAPASAPAASHAVAFVRGSAVNIRSGPGTGYSIYGSATYGTQLEPLAQNNGWYKVRTPFGTVGWIAGWLVSITPSVATSLPYEAVSQTQSAPASAPIVFTNDVTQIALRYVGYPYVWGTAGPSTFDSSGFVKYVYSQVGVSLPRITPEQYNVSGQRIQSMSGLQPGDIVFFTNTYTNGISHNGIYIGNGKMVHAGTSSTGVEVTNLNYTYWSSRFAGGLRPYR